MVGVVVWVFEQCFMCMGMWQVNFGDFIDGGLWIVGYYDYMVSKQDCFVDVVGDVDCGYFGL